MFARATYLRSAAVAPFNSVLQATERRYLTTSSTLFRPFDSKIFSDYHNLKMATPSKIQLSASQPTAFSLQGITDESAKKASELLQENHEKHHIFFNKSGFHVRGFLSDFLHQS